VDESSYLRVKAEEVHELGYGWGELAGLVQDPAWIDLCPSFLGEEGYFPDRLRKAVDRADK
tara:strand:- start:473 stop:655 length:183 start_codon:yes stop_codon:yes gene_type:complete